MKGEVVLLPPIEPITYESGLCNRKEGLFFFMLFWFKSKCNSAAEEKPPAAIMSADTEKVFKEKFLFFFALPVALRKM